MNAKAQFIEANGKPQYAVIPYRDYLRLVEAAEDAEDARAIYEFERKLAVGEEELLPRDIMHRLVEGENPMLVWRNTVALPRGSSQRLPVCGSRISRCWSAANGRGL
jgi:hypothetical protein